jgi:hypothetical protein
MKDEIFKQTIFYKVIICILFTSLVAFLFEGFKNVIEEEKKIIDNITKEKENLIVLNQKSSEKISKNPQAINFVSDSHIKLTSYIDNHLKKSNEIYNISTKLSYFGYILLLIGGCLAFFKSDSFQMAILISVSGIILNFISSIILVIFKSLMEQTKNYLAILEKTSLIGVSWFLSEQITDREAREKLLSEVALKILELNKQKE